MSDEEHLVSFRPVVKNFKPVGTIIPIFVQLLAATALETASLAFVFQQPQKANKCQSYFIVLYLVGAHWFISVIIDHILKYKHNEMRIRGYLDFYKHTFNHHRLPFYIVSLWTATLFIIQTLIQHFYFDNLEHHCLRADYFTPLNYIAVAVTIEFIILVVVIITYIRKVHNFNNAQPLPDVQREDWRLGSMRESIIQGEIGYGVQGDTTEDLLEKQADLIQYLRENNARLNEKIMILNAQLRSRGMPLDR